MNKADRTKAFIIEKVAPLFNKNGFAGTSLSDMTNATGLTKGSIYSNFSGKDEVALAVFDYNFQTLQGIINQEIKKKKTARAKLLVYARVYDNFLKHPFLMAGCPIQNVATEADDTHPKLRKKAHDAIISWKQSLIKLIKEGIATAEFNSDTDPDQLAFVIIALIEGGIMISKLTGKRKDQSSIRIALENVMMTL